MSGIVKSHYLWALLCAIGYFGLMIPGAMGALGGAGGIIALWIALSIIGVAGMWVLVPKTPATNKVVYLWVAVCVIGLIINGLQFMKILSIPGVNYGFVWLLITAIGFAGTGVLWAKGKEAYYAGAALNALVLIGTFAAKDLVSPNMFALLGIASVVPLVYAAIRN